MAEITRATLTNRRDVIIEVDTTALEDAFRQLLTRVESTTYQVGNFNAWMKRIREESTARPVLKRSRLFYFEPPDSLTLDE